MNNKDNYKSEIRKVNLEKTKICVRVILLSLLDFTEKIIKPGSIIYPSIFKMFVIRENKRQYDKKLLYNQLWRLEKQGYIKKFQSKKGKMIHLTTSGYKKAMFYLQANYSIKKPALWDKKWRLVIFDIPEEKKYLRDVIRDKLKKLKFYQLQKSVWVFPFECYEIIYYLKFIYNIGKYTQYIVAETIETETNLVDYFYDNHILDKNIEL